MVTKIPDPLDDWSEVMASAVMRAGKTWSEAALNDVFPTSLSAAGEEAVAEQMSLEAVLATTSTWTTVATEELTPVIIAFMAAQTWDVATARKIDLRPLSGVATTPVEHKMAFAKAYDLLEEMGYKAADIDVVVTSQTWVDTLQGQLAVTPNKVVGMPETVYRDMVGKLGKATREGLGQFDRNLLVREVLDMSTEGGFEAWNTRASRIARTETHRVVNAATLEAARMEQQISGEEVRKAWVCTWDERTRDEHFRADGQIVPLDGKFIIGGFEADFPGDPNLPARLSINCRCAQLLLDPDEELPDNSDRQTERERSDGSTRDPHGEVARRAARGVTRDADNNQGLVATAKENVMGRREWSGLLAPVGKPSGDGRILMEGAELGFRDFPLPLMFQKEQSMGHDTSVIVGKITEGTVEGDAIHATGVLFDTPEALEAMSLLEEEVIRPSVDLCDMVADYVVLDSEGKEVDIEEIVDPADFDGLTEQMRVTEAKVMGATLVAKPAFAEAKIMLGEETEASVSTEDEMESLVAAAAVATKYDSLSFANPRLSGPTPLTVDGEHVFGHLALWDTDHVSFPGKSVKPPKSATNYSLFHSSTVETEDGPTPVGRLTVGTGHAEARANVHTAAEHYDQTGSTWAFVRAGEDQYGIWVAGVVNPDAEASQVRAGASAPLSGDWRSVGGHLELVAALSVNTPGFPVPRSFAVEKEATMSLVAAGVAPRLSKREEMVLAVREAMRAEREEQELAVRVAEAEDRRKQARVMAAGLMAQNLNRGVK